MQAADIIVSANGKAVKDGQELVGMISAAAPGSTVDLKVLRDGKTLDVPVHIGDRAQVLADNRGGDQNEPGTPQGEATPTHLGISVQALDRSDRDQLGLSNGGVLIASVEPGSFAEDVGLQKGDVIVAINRKPVSSPADVRTITQTLKPGEAVAFKLMRNAGNNWNSLFLAGNMPAR
jgi:serine protease Do